MVFLRARWYDPRDGRFLGQDPWPGTIQQPATLHKYLYVLNNPPNLTDPSGEIALSLIVGGVMVILKVIDYGWTAWDIAQSYKVIKDLCASDEEKLLAALNIAMSVVFELVEPDELLPFGLPADDIGRRAAVRAAREGLEEAGMEGFERGVRNAVGDDIAERAFREMGLDPEDVYKIVCSFSEDTPVSTDGGLRAIGTLEIGDYVLAYDEATGQIGYYPVIGVWAHTDPIVLELTIDGESIETTPEHPFYTADGRWTAAGDLHVGDTVLKADGEYGIVEAIEFVHQPQPMYNLTVITAHTYFVGDGQWLVHNTCPGWLGGGKLPEWGLELAELADDIYVEIPYYPRSNVTIAATRIDGDVFVTINGGADRRAIKALQENSSRMGYRFIPNSTTDHAEVYLYKLFKDRPGFEGIGISHRSGVCPTCQPIFRDTFGFLNVFWTGRWK